MLLITLLSTILLTDCLFGLGLGFLVTFSIMATCQLKNKGLRLGLTTRSLEMMWSVVRRAQFVAIVPSVFSQDVIEVYCSVRTFSDNVSM